MFEIRENATLNGFLRKATASEKAEIDKMLIRIERGEFRHLTYDEQLTMLIDLTKEGRDWHAMHNARRSAPTEIRKIPSDGRKTAHPINPLEGVGAILGATLLYPFLKR